MLFRSVDGHLVELAVAAQAVEDQLLDDVIDDGEQRHAHEMCIRDRSSALAARMASMDSGAQRASAIPRRAESRVPLSERATAVLAPVSYTHLDYREGIHPDIVEPLPVHRAVC